MRPRRQRSALPPMITGCRIHYGLTVCPCTPVYPAPVDPWAPHPILPEQYRPEVNR